jgi:outer membrane immunogenic protein
MKKLFLSATAIATVMSASAIAADLPSIKSAPVSPTPLWTGFYAGLNAGYGFGTANNAQNYGWANPNAFYNNVSAAAFAGANSYMGRNITQGGFIGGGQAGYNYQYGKNFVLGFETDIQGAGIGGEGSATGVAPYQSQELYGFNSPIQAGVNWMGTARGRIGYLVAPSVLLYATGGLAYGGTYLKTFPNSFEAWAIDGGTVYATYISTQNAQQNFNVGWTAGGGAEWMMAPNWSIKGEALYYDLGNTSVSNVVFYPQDYAAASNPSGGSTTRAYYQGIIARAGVNYHFNFVSAPVVAKF